MASNIIIIIKIDDADVKNSHVMMSIIIIFQDDAM